MRCGPIAGCECAPLGSSFAATYPPPRVRFNGGNSMYVLVLCVIVFISGLIYELRLYKQMEADCNREWAKREECERLSRSTGEMPGRTNGKHSINWTLLWITVASS